MSTAKEREGLLRPGPVKRIHVDQQVIKANRKNGTALPALTVQTSKGPLKADRVDILGPSSLITSFQKPLSCGARVWIETHSRVEVS